MRNRHNSFLFLLLSLYAVFGIIHSNNQGFWHDEIYTLTFLKGISAYNFDESTLSSSPGPVYSHHCKDLINSDNFLKNIKIQIFHEGHPPIYFLLLKIWSLIFGYSELALRSFSLACGIISLALISILLKKNIINVFAQWATFIIVLINPFLFYYFTEARMYALAFLFAIISFIYWLKYKNHKNFKSYDFVCFALSSTALIYTHYYGLFFFLALVFYDFISNRNFYKMLSYTIPILLFLPWLFIIKIQTEYHSIHWTDGSLSFINSMVGFEKGLVSLLFSPMSQANFLQSIYAIVIGITLLYFSAKIWKKRFMHSSIILFYFLLIFTFDKVLDHHTILVARYYIFILIFFYWAVAKVIQNTPKTISVILISVYCISGGAALYNINSAKLAPKQMYRELAWYIDSRHNPQNTIIVVEPGGPVIWGLSNYLINDFLIVPAQDAVTIDSSKKVIFVDEKLGDIFWEDHLNAVDQNNLKLVPFVGLNLYE